MRSFKRFYQLHEKLVRLIDEQLYCYVNRDEEGKEQARLDILSTIDILRVEGLGVKLENKESAEDFVMNLFQ